ncbi:MAG: hypothetical protein MHM6MM_007824 [Cercozoa sp. M6MM]
MGVNQSVGAVHEARRGKRGFRRRRHQRTPSNSSTGSASSVGDSGGRSGWNSHLPEAQRPHHLVLYDSDTESESGDSEASAPYLDFNTSLSFVLEHNLLRREFELSVAARHATEHLLFLRDLDTLDEMLREPSKTVTKPMKTMISFIADEYVDHDAVCSVNISSRCRNTTLERVSDFNTRPTRDQIRNLFVLARQEVWSLLETNFLREFIVEFNRSMETSSVTGVSSRRTSISSSHSRDSMMTPMSMTPSPSATEGVVRVVIVGGGIAGATVAKVLCSDKLRRFHVTIIDNKTYMEYTPWITRVMLHPKQHKSICVKYADVLPIKDKTCRLIVGEARAIRDRHVVVGFREVHFDYCVVATGSHYQLALKSMGQSLEARYKQLSRLNRQVNKAKSALLIGGGLVACKLACEIKEATPGKPVQICTSGDRLLGRLPPETHDIVHERLTKELGVAVHLQERIVRYDENAQGFTSASGHTFSAEKSFWCGGAHPNTAALVPQFPQCLTKRGFARCNDSFQLVPDKKELRGIPVADGRVFVCGDICTTEHEKTVQFAHATARVVAHNM